MQEDKKEWNPSALRRLLAEVEPYHVDPGKLGEYASVFQSEGPDRAMRLFPEIAIHIKSGCHECQSEIESMNAIIREEGGSGPIPAMTPVFEMEPLADYSMPASKKAREYPRSGNKGKVDLLLTTIITYVIGRESRTAIEFPASWKEELVALTSKIPADERKKIESRLEQAIDQLIQKREELHRQVESVDKKIEYANSLLSSIRKPRE
jgi:hypothetical protein